GPGAGRRDRPAAGVWLGPGLRPVGIWIGGRGRRPCALPRPVNQSRRASVRGDLLSFSNFRIGSRRAPVRDEEDTATSGAGMRLHSRRYPNLGRANPGKPLLGTNIAAPWGVSPTAS